MDSQYLFEFNSARNALRVLIKEFKIEKIHIPFYLCPAVKNAIRRENCKIEFYHIDENFFPMKEFCEDDFIIYPNYFGICGRNVKKLAQVYTNLIVDNAHAFYSPHFGFASFNSYRKFFFHTNGLKDGALLRVNGPLKIEYKKDKTIYEQIINDFSYNSLLKNEKKVDEFEVLKISDCSKKILLNIDFEKDRQKRLEKFFEFDLKYKQVNELRFDLEEGEIPFVYPLLTKDEQLSENLTKGNNLILRYWTTLPKNFPEYRFYKYLIPLPLLYFYKIREI